MAPLNTLLDANARKVVDYFRDAAGPAAAAAAAAAAAGADAR